MNYLAIINSNTKHHWLENLAMLMQQRYLPSFPAALVLRVACSGCLETRKERNQKGYNPQHLQLLLLPMHVVRSECVR